ncbi:hypothetical protein BJ875DRAFT_547098 [Amylocarpus encephaloides]|uniref:C2H2-type domain-containing protein n=1 Tax=Amylocarpus encephaloides TaxID=45428 RepID=A0A9P7Y8W2_9HELO|nr:hypothetical protein BJ875DRAFT_547098 [Amylocarpus encephaloides]
MSLSDVDDGAPSPPTQNIRFGLGPFPTAYLEGIIPASRDPRMQRPPRTQTTTPSASDGHQGGSQAGPAGGFAREPVHPSMTITIGPRLDGLNITLQTAGTTAPPSMDASQAHYGTEGFSHQGPFCSIGHCGQAADRNHGCCMFPEQMDHGMERLFACREPGCGRLFSQLGRLNAHQADHTGVRCGVCQMAIDHGGNVGTHQQSHGGVERSLCHLYGCDMQCAQLGHLEMPQYEDSAHTKTIQGLKTRFAAMEPVPGPEASGSGSGTDSGPSSNSFLLDISLLMT